MMNDATKHKANLVWKNRIILDHLKDNNVPWRAWTFNSNRIVNKNLTISSRNGRVSHPNRQCVTEISIEIKSNMKNCDSSGMCKNIKPLDADVTVTNSIPFNRSMWRKSWKYRESFHSKQFSFHQIMLKRFFLAKRSIKIFENSLWSWGSNSHVV